MCFFTACLIKIIPLYMNILLGFIAGRVLQANRDTIARIMFYMINPIVVFNGIIHTQLHPDILVLPLITFLISTGLCFLFYKFANQLWSDSTVKLVAYSAGSGNTGYFGLPMALLLFDEQGVGVYIMAFLGVSIYENSLGMSLFASEKFTMREFFKSLSRLPTVYAMLFGLIINAIGLPTPQIFEEFMQHIKGAYAVLGMMIIGLGLATLDNFKIDFKFMSLTFLAKFVAWPLIILSIIFVDKQLFHVFNQQIYNALVLLSIVPLSVNTVIAASLTNSFPEKAATAVIISIFFGMFYVPFMANYFIT